MKRLLYEKLILIMVFIFFYFLIELIMFSWLNLGLLPKVLMVDFIVTIFLSMFAFVFKKHSWSVAYLSFLMIVFALIALVNQTMSMELNGEIFSVLSLAKADEGLQVFVIDFLHFDAIFLMVGLLVLYFLTMHLIRKYFFTKVEASSYYSLKVLPLYVLFVIGFSFSLTQLSDNYKHYSDLPSMSLFKRDLLNQYGMMGYYTKDLTSTIFNQGTSESIEDLERELVRIDPMNFDESDLESTYKGILEGKNIISIMVESGQSYAINEFLTPNIYKLTSEGLFFENYYAENSTKTSETIGILGNYPSEGISPHIYEYDLRYSLPNVLKSQGYRTAYFHENSGDFYSRKDTMPVLGFEDVYFHDDLFPSEDLYGWYGDYTLDSRTMESMLDYMFNEDDGQPFYYFWTSLVMHGPYNYNYPSDRGMNNLEKFEELGYFDLIDFAEEEGLWDNVFSHSSDSADLGRFRFYQAAMMDFDRAIGKLLEKLEEENLLEDTLIILYSDHNLYYHQMHLRLHDVEKGNIHQVELYKTMFTIYNEDLTNAYLANHPGQDTSVDKFITAYDIAPTIYHLLGIPYDKNFVFGESILTNEETVFYSHKISAFFNQEYFSFNTTDIYYPEDINLDTDLSAKFFLDEVEYLSDMIMWLEKWMQVSRTRK